MPGEGAEPESRVCKLVDTTTCIGCKACEVACLEWNGYTFSETTFDNSYQTMPETTWNYWNLIKFNEHEREDGTMQLLMRKDQCMHCAIAVASPRVPPMALSFSTPMASWIFRKRIALAAGDDLHHRLPVQHSQIQPHGAQSFQCMLWTYRVIG